MLDAYLLEFDILVGIQLDYMLRGSQIFFPYTIFLEGLLLSIRPVFPVAW